MNTDAANTEPVHHSPKPRVVGLHPGSMEMAPDFDDPLPDEFWFGQPIFPESIASTNGKDGELSKI